MITGKMLVCLFVGCVVGCTSTQAVPSSIPINETLPAREYTSTTVHIPAQVTSTTELNENAIHEPTYSESAKDNTNEYETDIHFSWNEYSDEVFNIVFEYPASWSIQDLVHEDGSREILLYHRELGEIVFTRENNLEQLTPRQWFEQKKGTRYDADLIQEIGKLEVQGNHALIIGQPDTCESYPMIVAVISRDEYLFVISQYETGSRQSAIELGHILETLSFGAGSNEQTYMDPSFIEFPVATDNGPCG